jgi:RNA polymerase primary sigma factor
MWMKSIKGIKIIQSITLKESHSLEQYLKDISKYEPLTKDEEIRYFQDYTLGDVKAGETLIKHNLRFVVSVAKKYQFSYSRLTLMDIISLGNLGLIKALKKYDPKRGVKFISYAVWWIRHSITDKAAPENDLIACPQSVYLNHKKVFSFINSFISENLCEPSVTEILDFIENESIIISSLGDVFKTSQVSLDSGAVNSTDSDGLRMIDIIQDDSLPAPDSQFEDDSLKLLVTKMLSILSWREKRIVQMYHGLDGYSEMGLQEIGDALGITPERARQVKRKAIGKMSESYKDNRVYPSTISTISKK